MLQDGGLHRHRVPALRQLPQGGGVCAEQGQAGGADHHGPGGVGAAHSAQRRGARLGGGRVGATAERLCGARVSGRRGPERGRGRAAVRAAGGDQPVPVPPAGGGQLVDGGAAAQHVRVCHQGHCLHEGARGAQGGGHGLGCQAPPGQPAAAPQGERQVGGVAAHGGGGKHEARAHPAAGGVRAALAGVCHHHSAPARLRGRDPLPAHPGRRHRVRGARHRRHARAGRRGGERGGGVHVDGAGTPVGGRPAGQRPGAARSAGLAGRAASGAAGLARGALPPGGRGGFPRLLCAGGPPHAGRRHAGGARQVPVRGVVAGRRHAGGGHGRSARRAAAARGRWPCLGALADGPHGAGVPSAVGARRLHPPRRRRCGRQAAPLGRHQRRHAGAPDAPGRRPHPRPRLAPGLSRHPRRGGLRRRVGSVRVHGYWHLGGRLREAVCPRQAHTVCDRMVPGRPPAG
mmetsp:Transcript_27660/g.71152  ORF Transcript_27660/g.71152 Transcript_27660/m.71152 type:complete len:459 (+) Transcript_27660:595-1971(+)